MWQHVQQYIDEQISRLMDKLYHKIARKIQLPDDGLRTETCRSSFSVLMCKFYISAEFGILIE